MSALGHPGATLGRLGITTVALLALVGCTPQDPPTPPLTPASADPTAAQTEEPSPREPDSVGSDGVTISQDPAFDAPAPELMPESFGVWVARDGDPTRYTAIYNHRDENSRAGFSASVHESSSAEAAIDMLDNVEVYGNWVCGNRTDILESVSCSTNAWNAEVTLLTTEGDMTLGDLATAGEDLLEAWA